MGNQQSRTDSRRSCCCVPRARKEEPYSADGGDGKPSQIINLGTIKDKALPTYSAPHDVHDYYHMKHPRRGIFMIIDNRNIDGLPPREGAEKEVTQLKNVFTRLGFEVRHLKDLDKKQVIGTMETVAHENHIKCDCFCMAVLTHGDEGDVLKAKDFGYYTHQLYEKFNGKSCVSLQGKPKIFIFNACKGPQEDQVDSICIRRNTCALGNAKGSTKLEPLLPKTEEVVTGHVYSDFLCAFSTWQGYKSYRHPTGGSLYIHYLCDELIKGAKRGDDLTLILARVSRRLAVSPPVDGKKILRQTSYYHSSLTKRVVLQLGEKNQ